MAAEKIKRQIDEDIHDLSHMITRARQWFNMARKIFNKAEKWFDDVDKKVQEIILHKERQRKDDKG